MKRKSSRNKRKSSRNKRKSSQNKRKQDCLDVMREVEEYQWPVRVEYPWERWFHIIDVHSDGIELRAELTAGPVFLRLRCYPSNPEAAVFRPGADVHYPCITWREFDILRNDVALCKQAEVAEELPWLLEGLPWLLDDLWKIVTQYF